jgi:hypothetical protein
MKSKKVGQYVKNNYTLKQKRNIAKKIIDLREKDVENDFINLKEIGCEKKKALSQTGNDIVNYFTFVERLNTIGNKNLNFYDVWQNKNALAKKKYVNNIISFYKNRKTKYPEAKVWYRISNLYFSAISIFKPQIAMDIYCLYNPTTILDFTMGWGGRLVGACALNVPKYIGIDMNTNLKTPYNKMTHFLKKHSTTEIELYFQDALSIDYSKLDYDLVLTSPPYYNIETYGDNVKKTKEEWDNSFYIPIFEKTFQHLKPGGHYCINIPNEVYENVAVKILGNPLTKIPLAKSKRTSSEKYNEFIYVWKK